MLKSAVSVRGQNLIHILYTLVSSVVFNLFKCSNLIPNNLIYVLLQSKIPVAMCQPVERPETLTWNISNP